MSVLWLGDEDNDGKYSIKVICFRWASPKLVSSLAVSANSDPSYGITADASKDDNVEVCYRGWKLGMRLPT